MTATMPYPELAPILGQRRSTYAFAATPVPESALASLFEAARWAFSAMNEQPWRYIVATRDDPEAFGRMVDVLMPGNVPWASQAPALILAIAKTAYTASGGHNPAALHDLGAANASLALQATSLGLVTHPMGGFDHERARQAFGIPEGYEPVAVIAVGYPGDPESLPEPYRGRELGQRTRRPVRDFAFRGRWAAPIERGK